MRDPSALTEDDIDEMVSLHRTDARIGGSWPPACGALLLARFFGTSGRLWINSRGRYMTGSGPGSGGAHWGE